MQNVTVIHPIRLTLISGGWEWREKGVGASGRTKGILQNKLRATARWASMFAPHTVGKRSLYLDAKHIFVTLIMQEMPCLMTHLQPTKYNGSDCRQC